MRTAGGLIPWIALDAQRAEPLYRQLYVGLREAVLSGALPAGTRLPSTRALAADLGVSRTTSVEAYRQLEVEGYVSSRVGAGTYVTATLPGELSAAPRGQSAPSGGAAPVRLSRRAREVAALLRRGLSRSEAVPFLPGVPALDAFPFDAWRRLAVRRLRRLEEWALAAPDPAGYAPLREIVSAQLRAVRGVRCEPGQVVITTGTQQALSRLAHLLLDPGDAAWIEDPGYVGARRALAAAGAQLVPVPVDESGLDVSAGVERAARARLAYVSPSHQFPLGVTLSLERRLRLLEWAAESDAWVLEDDYASEYRFEGRPLQALQGLDAAGRVIYIGTFSDMLFPALRLGYVVLPPRLVEPFVAAREADDGAPPVLDQLATAEFLRAGGYDRHVRRMHSLYRERRDALVGNLSEKCGSLVELGPAEAGMHLTVRLPPGWDDAAASERAAARGVTALPLSRFAIEPVERGGLVLGFAGWSPERIREAVIRLALAVAEG